MLALGFSEDDQNRREAQPEVGAIFSQLIDEEIDPEAAAPEGETSESLKEAAELIAGASSTDTVAAASASPEENPADEIYWCPMRGTAEGQCGLHDFHEPG
ncbi:MAG: hypothetical protein WD031_03855, partial [Gemmatimonadota bacterium]